MTTNRPIQLWEVLEEEYKKLEKPCQISWDFSEISWDFMAEHLITNDKIKQPKLLTAIKPSQTGKEPPNQTAVAWYTRIVTLSGAKGLVVRCFAALRMTRLSGRIAKCTNIRCFDLDGLRKYLNDKLKSVVDNASAVTLSNDLAKALTDHVLPDTSLYASQRFPKDAVTNETRQRAEELCKRNPTPALNDWKCVNRLLLEEAFPDAFKFKEDLRQDIALPQLRRHAGTVQFRALCLSGGGIRSATFGLGVLQELAAQGLLGKFHYLSTVSGGGYIGSWLTAWIHRHPRNTTGVIDELPSERQTQFEPEPAPIRWLREFSNYLTPQWGLLSADTWTWVAIYFRNLLLNWLVLLPLLGCVLAGPRLLVAITRVTPGNWECVAWLLICLGFSAAAWTISYIGANLPLTGNSHDQVDFLKKCLSSLLLSALLLAVGWAWWRNAHLDQPPPSLWGFVAFGILLHAVGGALYDGWPSFRDFIAIVLSGALGGLLVGWVVTSHRAFLSPAYSAVAYVCVAVPLQLILFLVATTLYIGFASRETSDADREWWARAGGWVLIAAVTWGVLSWLVLFAPQEFLNSHGAIQTAIGALGGVSSVITLFLGRSASTPVDAQEAAPADWMTAVKSNALTVAAPFFAAVIVVALSFGTDGLLLVLSQVSPQSFWALKDVTLLHHMALVLQTPVLLIAILVLLMAVACGLLGSYVNVNKFSLHAGYRDRLIRTYLGASRSERRPNKFSGFDLEDNVQMHDLVGNGLNNPLLVVNMALNLVSGDKLAWQERKAESFTVTPFYAGNFRLGYRRSGEYGGIARRDGDKDGISLGTAMAISGAAVSPNWGYHSSPVVTFLLALFNIRLGWWLGNPGPVGAETYRNRGPGFAVGPLVWETLGLTTNKYKYVYLSDGGHFDNLGLYEMVLRRCRLVVLSDAGADPDCTLDDLGGAIRKIRIDLGVPIEFEQFDISPRKGQRQDGKRYAIATIRYSAVDGTEPKADGILLYLKPALYGHGREPVDVRNYADVHLDFPHETTADQWFSESQFESYRMLGRKTVEETLTELAKWEKGQLPPCLEAFLCGETE